MNKQGKMKRTIPADFLSKVDKNETPISWMYMKVFFDNKWNWYFFIIMCFLGAILLTGSVLFGGVKMELEFILFYASALLFSVFYLFLKETVFLKIYKKELQLNHYYDNE